MKDRFNELLDTPVGSSSTIGDEIVTANVIASDSILEEADIIFAQLSTIREHLRNLEKLYDKVFSEISNQGVENVQIDINQLILQIQALLEDTRRKTKFFSSLELSSCNGDKPQDGFVTVDFEIRRNQQQRLEKSLLEVAKIYKNIQKRYNQQKSNQTRRHLKIIRPAATQDEIDRILENNRDDSHTLFRQEMLHKKYEEKKTELIFANDQYDQLQQIEGKISDLVKMFSDLGVLLQVQQEQIEVIDKKVEEAFVQIESGVEEVVRGIEYRKRYRKKAFWFLVFIFVVMGIVAIVLYFQLRPK